MRATSGGLGRAASTVDRDHGGEPRPAQPPDRIYTAGSDLHGNSPMLPHTGAHARLGEFHYNSG